MFDTNEPIETPPIFNTIDAGPPTSQVEELPEQTFSLQFEVSWTGQDDSGGSGVAYHDVYVSIDGDPFELWQEKTTTTSAMFEGVLGVTYSFASLATDNVGRREVKDLTAEASTTVAAGSAWQNPNDPLDVNDDGIISPIDALLIINYLNARLEVDPPPPSEPPYMDVNGDGIISPVDALLVINHLNARSLGGGSGEASLALGDPFADAVISRADFASARRLPARNRERFPGRPLGQSVFFDDESLARRRRSFGFANREDDDSWGRLIDQLAEDVVGQA